MKNWFDLIPRRPQQRDWLQVEVTSWCNASCIYCPRTVYRESWRNRHLSMSTFRRLVPYFRQARLIYLQGWGEPLLHPDFFAMAAAAKRAGCSVGTTTNGMLLDASRIRQLVETGIDVVAFSLAGIDEQNDVVRRVTGLRQILAAIEALHRLKQESGSPTPAIHVAYMLLRSGLPNLEKLPVLLQGSGVSQIVVSTLDFVAARELEAEALCSVETGEYLELQSRLQDLARLGKKCGLEIHYSLQDPRRKRLICAENVRQATVVSADGLVSPCVFTNLPVSGASYFHQGREHSYRQLFFGNVHNQSLGEIWDGKAYAGFRRSFADGRLEPPCRNCSKL